jgi:hypothetical protein
LVCKRINYQHKTGLSSNTVDSAILLQHLKPRTKIKVWTGAQPPRRQSRAIAHQQTGELTLTAIETFAAFRSSGRKPEIQPRAAKEEDWSGLGDASPNQWRLMRGCGGAELVYTKKKIRKSAAQDPQQRCSGKTRIEAGGTEPWCGAAHLRRKQEHRQRGSES